MNLQEYGEEVQRTAASYQFYQEAIAVFGLGLTGEAGEVADLIKKHIGHGHPMAVAAITKELGDVIWYWMALCQLLKIDPEEVLQANVKKLRARYPDGFSVERSKNREQE
jgi:NTP pyrophosphatase (non-canonical NTP hydrolase)